MAKSMARKSSTTKKAASSDKRKALDSSARKSSRTSPVSSAADKGKTKDQLIKELARLRREVARLEKSSRQEKNASVIFEHMQAADIITENIGAGLCIISPEYKTIWANEVIKDIFGDTIGKTCHKTYNQQNDICPWCAVKEVFEQGKKQVITEATGKDQDGNPIWSRIIATPIYDENGTIKAAFELVVPITELKLAQESLRKSHDSLDQKVKQRTAELNKELRKSAQIQRELKKSENKYKELVATVNTAIIVHASDTSIIMSNQAAQEMLELTEQDVTGVKADSPIWKFVREDGSDMPLEEYPVNQVISSGSALSNLVIGVNFPDHQTTKWFIVNAHPLFDSEQQEIVVSFMDITDRKNAETEVRKSEERLRQVIDESPMAIILSRGGKFITVNNEALRIVGAESRNEIIGKSFRDFLAPEFREEVWQRNIKRESGDIGPLQYEAKGLRADGTEFPIEVHASTINLSDGLATIAFIKDITERKKAAAEVSKNAAIFDNLADNLAEGVYLIGLDDMKIKWANPVFEKMFGYDRGELIGKQVDIVNAPSEMTPEETRTSIRQTLEETGEWHGEVHNIKKDGTHFWCNANVSIFDHPEYGKVSVSVHTDITERKEIEQKLHQSHDIFETVLNSMDAIVYVADMDTYELLFVNEYTKKLLGDDIIGKPCWQTLQVDQSGPCDFCTNKFLLDGQGNPAGAYRWDFKNTRTGLWFSISDNAIRWIDGRIVRIEIAKDVTELKNLEEELRNALNSKDFLIREVNHRVKNNLAILQSLVSMQSSFIRDNTVAKDCLENVSNRIRTLSMIHERLYKTSDVTVIEIEEYISSLAREIYKSLAIDESQVELELDIAKAQLHLNHVIPCGLIINELLTNAMKHAFPVNAKGKVSIIFKAEQDKRFSLTVKDTGIGLPDGFDMAKVDGLGMKVVQSLAMQLNGILEYTSDKGTEFSISFKEE
jgi:PAS domain S-box-containing protein